MERVNTLRLAALEALLMFAPQSALAACNDGDSHQVCPGSACVIYTCDNNGSQYQQWADCATACRACLGSGYSCS